MKTDNLITARAIDLAKKMQLDHPQKESETLEAYTKRLLSSQDYKNAKLATMQESFFNDLMDL